jgi:hypothetical protein
MESSETDRMSISPISGPVLQYRAPQTPQAKVDDERTESMTVKTKEAETGKDSPLPVQTKIVAVNIKV